MEIVIIRHGKPGAATNPKLSASGFDHWVKLYDRSKVDPLSSAPKELGSALDAHFIVASDLARSIDSVKRCLDKNPDLVSTELREIDIPRFALPFHLKAYTWLTISRILWFIGIHRNVESVADAKKRAKQAVLLL